MAECHSHCEDAGTDTAIIRNLIADDGAACSIHDKPDISFNATDFDIGFIGSQYFAGFVIMVIDKRFDADGSGFAVVSYVVDEETKWIVEKIFELAYHGSGAASIAHRLIEEKVPTSGWLNYTRYGTFAHIYADAPKEKQYDWSIGQVKEILKDETYIGNSIHNKQTNISYKNKKKIRKPKEEWFRIENTHEPIISKDVFYHVQEPDCFPQKKAERWHYQDFLRSYKMR